MARWRAAGPGRRPLGQVRWAAGPPQQAQRAAGQAAWQAAGQLAHMALGGGLVGDAVHHVPGLCLAQSRPVLQVPQRRRRLPRRAAAGSQQLVHAHPGLPRLCRRPCLVQSEELRCLSL